MSMPNIPNITPVISLERCEVIDLLLSSIALEEIGLSNILNAEGEKLQFLLNTGSHCPHDILKINESVNKTLRTIVKSQMLLQFKLEDVITLNEESNCNPPDNDRDPCHKHCHCKKPCNNHSCGGCGKSDCPRCHPNKPHC